MATQTTRRVISERLVAALLTAVLIALVSFTVYALNKEKIMPQEVTLELGKNGAESFKQAGAVAGHRTAGEIVGFLELDWKPSALGVVTIRHGRHDLTIPHTFTAMGCGQTGHYRQPYRVLATLPPHRTGKTPKRGSKAGQARVSDRYKLSGSRPLALFAERTEVLKRV